MLPPCPSIVGATKITSTIGLVGASREDIFCGCPAMRMGLECASKSGSSRDNLKSVPLRYHIYRLMRTDQLLILRSRESKSTHVSKKK